MNLIMVKKIVNKVLKLFEISHIPISENVVYITFDDAPEPDITEFVLSELDRYNMKATFFCKGQNAELYPVLFQSIRNKGHAIGNHTYSHIHAFKHSYREYIKDVEKADRILHSHLFRPPWGSLTFLSFLRLRGKYKIIYWSLESGDTELNRFDLQNNIGRLKTHTKPGVIILFHCCKRHQGETRQLLPLYLKWLVDNGYTSKVIED